MLSAFGLVLVTIVSLAFIKLAKVTVDRRNSPLAELGGPSRTGNGSNRKLFSPDDHGFLFEEWAKEHGAIYKVSLGLGWRTVVLCDPKAISYMHAKDGYTYVRHPILTALVKAWIGPSMFSADKENHRRLRRAMAPAFSNTTLRGVLDVFYDSGHKLKTRWDELFESNTDSAIINVQDCMNRITFDSIGIAGFGHDFKSLEGHKSPAFEAFERFSSIKDSAAILFYMLVGLFIPQVVNIPTEPARYLKNMKKNFSDIAEKLIEDSQRSEDAPGSMGHRSIIGLLLKGQSSDTKVKLSQEEVLGQVSTSYFLTHDLMLRKIGLFLLAGYESTAISLSWALIELARNAEIQEKLREELRQLPESNLSWEQLMSGLPYLDAVVHETLRLHPPGEALIRVADEDDIIPLSSPLTLPSGRTVESISIPKGTILTSPFVYINTCEAFWGPDARQFVPERWLRQDNPCKSKDLGGHRQLYTFSDGPRICPGKTFALAEFKAALLILIRNFTFELPDGLSTKVEISRASVLPRPKLAGEVGCALPMRVRQVIS